MEPSRNEGIFIAASNILIAVVVCVDLFVITGFEEVDLTILTLVNLVVVVIALFAFRVKRRIRLRKMGASSQPSQAASSPPTPSQEPRSSQ